MLPPENDTKDAGDDQNSPNNAYGDTGSLTS